jgi:drug/metabolite transporter (DMT)-like permease
MGPDQPIDRQAVLRGRLLVAAAALLWSTSGFFAKAPLFASWPVESRGVMLAFWRAAFACLALWPMVRRPEWSWRLVPAMLIFAAMNFTYLSAMVRIEASNAIWLQNTAPLWVLLGGVLLFKERASRLDYLLVALGTAGVGLILFFELREGDREGITYGVLAGITYAAVILSLRRMRDFESAWLIALNHLAVVVVLAPFVFLRDPIWPSGTQWAYLAGFGILQMGLPYLLFARGMKSIPGHEAAGIALLEPVLLPLWVYLAWGHTAGYTPPRWWTIVGGGLILSGLAVRFAGEWGTARLKRAQSDA